MQLLRELVRQQPEDIRPALQQGLLQTLASSVSQRDDAEAREAALALLALLAQYQGVVAVAAKVSGRAQLGRPCDHLCVHITSICTCSGSGGCRLMCTQCVLHTSSC